ncbi:hypothetical protein NWP10_06415 [Micrococcus sp. HG099]|uniref:hypothetical protein n=1 Tax=Micrococcus sp. HG099 TaxID=2969755 RepID=UPI00215A6A7A|nr:hypothetical protein [Micrococcus sp. HG099]MCR8675433.1 hypothetical protein [Micrococcus sp. HG099]
MPRQNPTGRARRGLPLAALGAAAALVLTGCGASGEDASAAWDRARTQLEETDSVRMVTELRSDAPQAGNRTPESVDLSGPVDGSSMRYVSTYEDGDLITRDESRVVDGTAYSRFTVERRGASGEDRPAYVERWTAAPHTGDPRATGMGAMVSSLLGSLPESGGLEDVAVDADGIRRSGQDAVRYVLDEPLSVADDGVAMTAFTVSEEDGRLLTVETESAGTKAVVTVSEMGDVEPLQAPPSDEVLPQQQGQGAPGAVPPGGAPQDGTAPGAAPAEPVPPTDG